MTTSSDRLNLLDAIKAQDPNGKHAMVAEVLAETNEILEDMPVFPSNAQFGNRVTIRSNLPTVAFTRINQGTSKSKATTHQVNDTIGILMGRSEADVKLKIVLGESGFLDHRHDQDMAFAEAMAQTLAETLLYGDELTSEVAFTGVQPRLTTLSTALSGSRVVSAGSPGSDATSIYVFDWHPRYVHGIYPPAAPTDGNDTKMGLTIKTLGEQQALDPNSLPFTAMVTEYTHALGLTVKDPRHIGRLCNIDISDISTSGASGYAGPDLLNKLTDLLGAMPPPNGAKRVLYAHYLVWTAIKKQAMAKSNAALSYEDFMGKGPTPFYDGYPIRRCDRISITESTVS
jgi:hypothetical protein